MSRVVKNAAIRRNEIVDAAQQLFYAKGYTATSVQDILNSVGIAKGTFYYYFDSKLDLLCVLIDRMREQVLAETSPIVTDARLNAPEKMARFFAAISNWKTERKDFLLGLLQVWTHDDNLFFRHKLMKATAASLEPLLATIVRQGIDEGTFSTDYPEEAATILYILLQTLSDIFVQLLLDKNNYDPALIERKAIAYQQAMERVLGAPKNSLKVIDMASIKLWFE